MTGSSDHESAVMPSHSSDSMRSHESAQPLSSRNTGSFLTSSEPSSPMPGSSLSTPQTLTAPSSLHSPKIQASLSQNEEFSVTDTHAIAMPQLEPTSDPAFLGVQQLERQQAEVEMKRALAAQQQTQQVLIDIVNAPEPPASNDDDTAPSSTTPQGDDMNNTTENKGQLPHSSSIGRFFFAPMQKQSRHRSTSSAEILDGSKHQRGDSTVILSPMPRDEEDDMYTGQAKPLVYGYLYKLGRNGVWQKRFFETDGVNLTYYKNNKRTKILATLDLCKVGDICIDDSDMKESTFTIQVADRPYYLRADDSSTCKDWVINLNRIREARVHLGGVQLVPSQYWSDERNRSDSGDFGPRVLVSANRERTHRASYADVSFLNDTEGIGVELTPSDEYGCVTRETQPHSQNSDLNAFLRPDMMARWQKRRTSMQLLKYKLTQWARRIRALRGCVGSDPALSNYSGEMYAVGSGVDGPHQNQHDETDNTHNFYTPEISGGPSAWIGKETEIVNRSMVVSEVDALKGTPIIKHKRSPVAENPPPAQSYEAEDIRHLD
mmetsp:Transcript_26183/g.40136  ORF Transcript_26183/g.40136 Transcript_26183/m.40136 type:complete len:548 (+) Transcript_26183:267-1910(+)